MTCSDLARSLNVCFRVLASSAWPWSYPIGGSAWPKISVCLRAFVSWNLRLKGCVYVCLVQHINLASCLSIALFVCMGCVYLFTCVHLRLRLFGGVLARLAYLPIRVVIAQALACLYIVN